MAEHQREDVAATERERGACDRIGCGPAHGGDCPPRGVENVLRRALGGDLYPHMGEHLAWLIEQDEQAMQAERQRGIAHA